MESAPHLSSLIVPRLRGGLGNQLFQIAFSYALARDIGLEFAINYDDNRTPAQGNHQNVYRNNLFSKIKAIETTQTPDQIVNEKNFGKFYEIDTKNIKGYVETTGYWQNTMWWKHREQEIIDLIPLEHTKHTYAVIHFRGGDYFKTERSTKFHALCGENYYLRAMAAAKQKGFSAFHIITDDAPRALAFLAPIALALNCTIEIKSQPEIEDLKYIAGSPCVIMSNSTFVWWGCFLGSTPIAICPNKWINAGAQPDIMEPHWDIVEI